MAEYHIVKFRLKHIYNHTDNIYHEVDRGPLPTDVDGYLYETGRYKRSSEKERLSYNELSILFIVQSVEIVIVWDFMG
jgi:hypothetical protein